MAAKKRKAKARKKKATTRSQRGRSAKTKGKVGEREFAKKLRKMGFVAARRGQQRSGVDQDDVIGGIPNTHAEVKRTERLSLYKAIEQAANDAQKGEVPYVAHRRNGDKWLLVIRLADVRKFAEGVLDETAVEIAELLA